MGVNGATQNPVQLRGVRRLDTEQDGAEGLKASSLPPVEFEHLRLDIPEDGVPLEAEGHCKLYRPLIDPQAAAKVKNRPARGFLQGASWFLNKLHTGISYAYAVVAKGDSYVFQRGLDRVTGLNHVNDKWETHLRWGERATAVTLGAALYHGVRSGSLAGALQGTKSFWKGGWPIAAMLYLSQTKVASALEEKGAAIGVGALAGALLLLNFPANKAYRRVITGKGVPMPLYMGLLFGLSHFALNYYWDNVSAQQRLLPILHHQPYIEGYEPWQWDWELTQANTTIAHSIGWGLFGSAWGGLLKVQTSVVNKGFRWGFGFGSEVYALEEGSAAYRFVNSGVLSSVAAVRGVKAFLTTFRLRPLAFTAASTVVGLPLGIALSRLQFEAQDFSSMQSVTGTPARSIVTAPLSTAGIAACAAMFGVAHPWCAYAWNMYPVNWAAQACAQQGEMIYQVAKKIAYDYKESNDPNERRHLATLLFNLHRAAHNNGKAKEDNEKLKVGELLADVGIDVQAIEKAAVRYASPQAE